MAGCRINCTCGVLSYTMSPWMLMRYPIIHLMLYDIIPAVLLHFPVRLFERFWKEKIACLQDIFRNAYLVMQLKIPLPTLFNVWNSSIMKVTPVVWLSNYRARLSATDMYMLFLCDDIYSQLSSNPLETTKPSSILPKSAHKQIFL